MKQISIYKNKRNNHKFIEVRRYSSGNYYARQYMEFENGVKNYTGSRTGRMFRFTLKTLVPILEDYTLCR